MNIDFNQLQDKYKKIIQETDKAILNFSQAIDIADLIKSNHSYIHFKNKIFDIIEGEKKRYIYLLDLVATHHPPPGTICDLGTFIPYLPIALSLLGYKVKTVDNYSLYTQRLKNEMATLSKQYDISAIDIDIIRDDFRSIGINDVVLLTAVVEHLNGSPKMLMEKARNIVAKNGFLLFEVPNIAEFIKRISFLMGKSPLPLYEDYFLSDYPYTGHNREMTVSEVQYLLRNTGFNVDFIHCYDYFSPKNMNFDLKILCAIKNIIPLKNKNQCILAKASPIIQPAR